MSLFQNTRPQLQTFGHMGLQRARAGICFFYTSKCVGNVKGVNRHTKKESKPQPKIYDPGHGKNMQQKVDSDKLKQCQVYPSLNTALVFIVCKV